MRSMPGLLVAVLLLPLLAIKIVVAIGSSSSSSINSPPRCMDPMEFIANDRFRSDVHFLHGELYTRSGEPIQSQYNHILDQRKNEIGIVSADPDLERLDTLINEISDLQSELKRLLQELSLFDDYEDEGGLAAYLDTVRSESSRTDGRFVSRMRYMNRPRLEKVEELYQSYLRNQMTIDDYDAALAAQGVQQDELQQLHDFDIDHGLVVSPRTTRHDSAGSDSDDQQTKSVGGRLSWRLTSAGNSHRIDSRRTTNNDDVSNELAKNVTGITLDQWPVHPPEPLHIFSERNDAFKLRITEIATVNEAPRLVRPP